MAHSARLERLTTSSAMGTPVSSPTSMLISSPVIRSWMCASGNVRANIVCT
eukprot:CAMPEP_0206278316 /NCGR_PEP_ID=MMETSP0047_2-20121206/37352_1 /ASSEMBLY_ACC=CAM_ASM_000192 /TAXON_ID=195065 /ORGANISM="Chroomonas mesostigmatica_cf, Strain CCMP1168" /LENGTH=50 /DNA_ID=CAMNT_0053708047 /DNA_START=24 /DNA_END=172 /DNA_ORIENTATION=+